METKTQQDNHFEEEYVNYIVRWGRITNLTGAALSFLPAILVLVVFGITAPIPAVIKATITQISASFAYYVVDPIAFFPILGIAGTYMAFLTGNVSNLRLPSAANALKAAEVEAGTPEATIISTLGIGSSVLVNTVILSIGVVIGNQLFQILPEGIKDSLNFLVPAIFGAVFAQLSFETPKIGMIALAISVVMTIFLRMGAFNFLGEGPSYVVSLTTIFGTILISNYLYKKGRLKV